MLLYALTWPAAWLDSRALRMHRQDYQRMLIVQITRHGDPERYRAYFPKYLLKCLQDLATITMKSSTENSNTPATALQRS